MSTSGKCRRIWVYCNVLPVLRPRALCVMHDGFRPCTVPASPAVAPTSPDANLEEATVVTDTELDALGYALVDFPLLESRNEGSLAAPEATTCEPQAPKAPDETRMATWAMRLKDYVQSFPGLEVGNNANRSCDYRSITVVLSSLGPFSRPVGSLAQRLSIRSKHDMMLFGVVT